MPSAIFDAAQMLYMPVELAARRTQELYCRPLDGTEGHAVQATPIHVDSKAFAPSERVDPKTQICFDFTKGVCARGLTCKYSHDLDLIVRVNSQERGVCFDFLRGQCQRGQLCRFSHDVSNIAAQQGQV